MSLFQFNFDKPGPGVHPDEPRKTGYPRFEELLLRNGGGFFKAGLLACFSFLPFYLGLAISVTIHMFPLMVAAGILGGLIAGPQLTGLADTILRAQRDEPGDWWLTYKDAWKKNWKASLVPGALIGFLFACLVYAVMHLNMAAIAPSVLLGFILSALVLLSVFTYIFPQLALFDMSLSAILRNTMILTLRHPLFSLKAAFLQAIYWAVFLAFYPISQLMLPLTGLWFPMFMGLSVIYPSMEEDFDLEALVKEHQEQTYRSEEE